MIRHFREYENNIEKYRDESSKKRKKIYRREVAEKNSAKIVKTCFTCGKKGHVQSERFSKDKV